MTDRAGLTDTAPDIRRLQLDRYRQMNPVEKLACVRGLTRAAASLALAGLRIRHPGAGQAELRIRMAALSMGRELAARAYGWVPPDGF